MIMNLAEKEDQAFQAMTPADRKLCVNLLTGGYIARPSQYWQCLIHFEKHGQLVPLITKMGSLEDWPQITRED